LPPEDPTRSDEDSGPEDDDGNIDNLTGNQLRAEAEASVTIVGFDKKHLGITKDDDSDSVLSDEAGSQLGKRCCETAEPVEAEDSTVKRRRRSIAPQCSSGSATGLSQPSCPKKTPAPSRQWIKCDLKQPVNQWNILTTPTSDRSPSSVFELFFDHTVIDHITAMTNLYAMQKNSRQLGATSEEIRLVIAVLLVLGYVPLVHSRMFWESGVRCP